MVVAACCCGLSLSELTNELALDPVGTSDWTMIQTGFGSDPARSGPDRTFNSNPSILPVVLLKPSPIAKMCVAMVTLLWR